MSMTEIRHLWVTGSSQCQYQRQYRHNKKNRHEKILYICLWIIKEANHAPRLPQESVLWRIKGEVALIIRDKKKMHHFSRTLTANESISIGSWNPIYKLPDSEDCSKEIPLEDLESLANNALLDIKAYNNGAVLTTECLLLNVENLNLSINEDLRYPQLQPNLLSSCVKYVKSGTEKTTM